MHLFIFSPKRSEGPNDLLLQYAYHSLFDERKNMSAFKFTTLQPYLESTQEQNIEGKTSHVMRKPVYAIWEQQRHRSACTSVQSDQRLCFSLPG